MNASRLVAKRFFTRGRFLFQAGGVSSRTRGEGGELSDEELQSVDRLQVARRTSTKSQGQSNLGAITDAFFAWRPSSALRLLVL